MNSFRELDTEVIGISFDTLEEHERFVKEYDLEFPLVPDEDGRIRALGYGSGRVTFVIDRKGIVRYSEEGIPDNARLLKVIKGLDYGK